MAQPAAPSTDAFAQAPEAGTQPATSFNPVIFGDLSGSQSNFISRLAGLIATPTANPNQNKQQVRGNFVAVHAPAPFQTAIKISEDESPRPQNRFFVGYNYFNNVDKSFLAAGIPASDLHRQLVGFERTFLEGDASIGLRLPIFQLVGNPDFVDSHVGDLSIILKYAFINNRSTGDVVSAGMLLATPTGQGLQVTGQSTINPVIFQPFFGYILNAGDVYVQGFTSLQVPTDARDITLLYNDIAVGYWLYRNNDTNSTLKGVVPDLELHVNTPLNHRGITDFPIGFTDTVDLTAGSYFVFRRATLGMAVGVPLTGPKPFDVEAIANLNIRY
jgi:hypothetical protein